MKKLLVFLAACVISLTGVAQSHTGWNNIGIDTIYKSGDNDEWLNIVFLGDLWKSYRPYGQEEEPEFTWLVSPSGNDSWDGQTLTAPFKTIDKLWTVISAGDTALFRGGTYYFDDQQYLTGVNGTPTDTIKLYAYPDEIPIFTKSGSYSKPTPHLGQVGLIYFTGKFFHWRGIEISNYTQPVDDTDLWVSLYAYDADSNIFEQMHCHHNGGGFYMRGSCEGNYILNGDFHHNQDPYSSSAYDNADGMALAWNSTADLNDTNTVEGCRFWKNSDDGLDLWANEGHINIINCWSWNNGYIPDTYTVSSEGNGFKYGSDDVTATDTLRYTTHCISFSNSMVGFNKNDAECDMVFLNNTAYKNGKSGGWGGGFEFWWATGGADYGAHNNIAHDNLPDEVSWDYDTYVDTNSWDHPTVTFTDADFLDLSDSTSLNNARQSDGSLPIIDFMELASGSDAIDAGSRQYGIAYNGTHPDLGAKESNYSVHWIWIMIWMVIYFNPRNRKKFKC